MVAFRFCRSNHAKDLSCSKLANRWNKDGRNALYASENSSLAILENTKKRVTSKLKTGTFAGFVVMEIEVPDDCVEVLNVSILPNNWREEEGSSGYQACQEIGDKWLEKAEKLVLMVPSAVNPFNFNYVINADHPDFNKVKIKVCKNFE